jgi:putative copper resistance protein D
MMQALYLVSVWIHILAATAWVGGMFFLVLVVVPWLRRGGRVAAGAFLRETGERFRTVGWVCFAVLLVTGTFNLWVRGVGLSDFVDPVWLGSPLGRVVVLKLGLFAVVLGVSAFHDFLIGPAAARAIEREPASVQAEQLRRRASLLGRLNALLALTLVAAAVVLVRGWPF